MRTVFAIIVAFALLALAYYFLIYKKPVTGLNGNTPYTPPAPSPTPPTPPVQESESMSTCDILRGELQDYQQKFYTAVENYNLHRATYNQLHANPPSITSAAYPSWNSQVSYENAQVNYWKQERDRYAALIQDRNNDLRRNNCN